LLRGGAVSQVKPLEVVLSTGNAQAVRRELKDERSEPHLADLLGETHSRHVADRETQSRELLQLAE
jgi:hypothetical protein